MGRHGIDVEGIDAEFVTFTADSSLTGAYATGGAAAVEGKAVALTGDMTVGYGVTGDRLFGKVIKYERDGLVSVQFDGFTWVPGNATLPAAKDVLAVDGAGAVKVAAAGAFGPVAVSINATDKLVAVCLL